MSNLEHQEQCALVNWARLQAITKPQLHNLFAVPNGGNRNLITAVNLKKEGVKPGVPDLFLAYPNTFYYGLFVEMKSKKGVVSEHQKDWLERLNAAGYLAKVCYGFEEARNEILAYLDEVDISNI